MTTEIRVLLADDHSLVRKGFRRLLDDEAGIKVVGEACNGVQAVELARSLRPDVIVMDMAMPGLNGNQATIEILKFLPGVGVVILSMYEEANYVRNAMKAGARGYLLKNASEVDLAAAIRNVARGRKVIDEKLQRPFEIPTEGEAQLTPRERQILQLIAEAKSTREIAGLLDLSVNTVAVHRANIMDRLGVHKTAELVLYAVRSGIAQIP
ncbi:MAG TPA: response regulator transcription factor [Bryobacteraceae bacterium]|jgi:DNA-binding NarL/FixJ family response regulator|nr:response regulator transcription factor [Bryobacteraceae bacterium]